MRHLKFDYPVTSVDVIDLALPFKVQAPTFASVSDAYAYFTRHQDKYAVPDYSDDSDDLPQFVSPDEADDFFVDPPKFSERPEGGEPPSSPENEEGDEELAIESTDEAEG